MKCKACNQETDKETTKITMTFSVSHPEGVDIKVENNYEEMSILMCMENREQLHKMLDKTLDEIGHRIFEKRVK